MFHRSRRMPDVPRKSDRELELMREAGRIVAKVLAAIEEAVQPGVSTAEIDKVAEEIIVSAGAIPSFKGYRGYPATICADPDDIVVHGIPSDEMVLKEGQIFGVDVGAEYQGYHGDAAITWPVGDISSPKRALLEATREARDLAVAAAQAGAEVTHVDASKRAVTQARRNQDLSGLAQRPIRWIVEDALKYLQREVRRGSRYEGLILDPPKFGRGAGGQVWEFFEHFPALLDACRELLSPEPLFVVITAYAVPASALALYHALEERLKGLGGVLTAGELVTVEQSAGRWLSQAIFARWSGLETRTPAGV